MSASDAIVRPRILLASDPFSEKIGGIKSFVLDFVRFAPDDFEPEIVGCTSDLRQRPVGRWTTLDIDGRAVRYLPVLATPNPNRRSRVPTSLKFAIAATMRRTARRVDNRVLQFHEPGVPAGFLRAAAPKILVAHLNVADIDGGDGESRWSALPGLLHRFEDVTLPRMDRIFVVNRSGLDFYRRRHPRIADRLSFLPTSVDQTVFRPLDTSARAAARQSLREELSISPDARIALFVGRLERQKDPGLLVDSFAAAARADDRLNLVVVGDGGLRDDAVARATAAGMDGRIHWLGTRPRGALPRMMNSADTLLLTSAFEGMPITVLEALACGLPVVSTAVGEVPLVVRDGKNGRLVEERSPVAVAEAIEWVVRQPADTFAAAAREAVAPYSPPRVLEPFFDAHREVHRARWTPAQRDAALSSAADPDRRTA